LSAGWQTSAAGSIVGYRRRGVAPSQDLPLPPQTNHARITATAAARRVFFMGKVHLVGFGAVERKPQPQASKPWRTLGRFERASDEDWEQESLLGSFIWRRPARSFRQEGAYAGLMNTNTGARGSVTMAAVCPSPQEHWKRTLSLPSVLPNKRQCLRLHRSSAWQPYCQKS